MAQLSADPSSILVVVGMHRSGTSLTASLLQSAGLHIGRRLMGSNEANVKGYFENLDFYDFHQAVLKSQGVSEGGWTLQERIEVEDRFVDLAKQVVERSAVSRLWGWKDPRTTLFLDFWSQQLPQAKFLLVYRSPWEVVDSLYRRGSDRVLVEQPELAVKMWLHYNCKVLNFYNQATDRCFLVNIETLVSDLNSFVAALNQKFGLDLTVPEATGYDPALFHRLEPNGHRASLVAHYFPEAVEIYRELESRSWQSGDALNPSWEENLQSSPYRVWAFQDWFGVGKLKGENQRLQEELEQERAQQQQLKEELQQERSQRHQTQENLEQEKAQQQQLREELQQERLQLHQTYEELEQERAQRKQLSEELGQNQAQLHETEKVLEQSMTQLNETEEVLEQAMSQLQQKTEKFNQTQAQLHDTQEELERSQSQLHQIQERTNYQKAITDSSNISIQVQYKLLVRDGWFAYLEGDLAKMSEYLKKSLKYTTLSGTAVLSNWLELFRGLCVNHHETQFNIQEVIDSNEWKKLMNYITKSKSLAAKKFQK